MNQNETSRKKRIMPSEKVIAKKVALVDRIHQLENEEDADNNILSELYCQNCDLNDKYIFFDQIFEENGKKGLRDITGALLVPALYTNFDEVYHYDFFRHRPVPACEEHDKFALVKTDGTGTPITPFLYDSISTIESGPFYFACIGEKGAILTPKGKEFIPCIIDTYGPTLNELCTFTSDGKQGIFTNDGLYVPPIFDDIDDKDEYLYVRLGDKWGYVSEEGKFIDENDVDTLDDTLCLRFFPDF